VDATTDIDPPRRHWRLTNPALARDRGVHGALRAFRDSILRGRYTLADHVGLRMVERGIDFAAVLQTVQHGRTCTVGSPPGWIGGAYLFDEVLVIVGTRSILSKGFEELVPEIGTVYHVDQFEPCRPLTVPVGELAQLQA